MRSTAMASSKHRSTISIVFTSTVRVLFTTLLFSAAGMGAGLFCGIVGTVIYGMMKGTQVDMSNAYKHVAIPAAIVIGSAAFLGALVLELRAHRQRTSR
jgi:lipopolysaccharide export LptBFGC system permease protein LptF